MKQGDPSSVEQEGIKHDQGEEDDFQSVENEELAALVKEEDVNKTPPPKGSTATAPPAKDLRARYKYNLFCRLLFL